MKIRIVFKPVRIGSGVGKHAKHGLLLQHIVGDDGTIIVDETVGEWIADGDVEALCLTVVPTQSKCATCNGTGEPLEAHEADTTTRCHMCEGTGNG